jgi:hypothetical protein
VSEERTPEMLLFRSRDSGPLVTLSVLLAILTLTSRSAADPHPEKFSCEPNNQFAEHLKWIPALKAEQRYFEIEVSLRSESSRLKVITN